VTTHCGGHWILGEGGGLTMSSNSSSMVSYVLMLSPAPLPLAPSSVSSVESGPSLSHLVPARCCSPVDTNVSNSLSCMFWVADSVSAPKLERERITP